METARIVSVFEALGQQTRLDALQLLLKHEPEGLSSGDVARKLKIPQNTMSSHLATLSRAGLVRKQKRSRFVIYHANRVQLKNSLSFIVKQLVEATKSAGSRSA